MSALIPLFPRAADLCDKGGMQSHSGRALFVICVACGAWAMSFGLGSQVVSHWLAYHGYSNSAIGLNHTAYYLGLAVASLAVPALMRRWGGACPMAGMILSAATLALFPLGGGLTGYFILRLLNGAAGALSLIPLETLIGRDSRPERRTRNFACYGVALTLGGAIGIWLGLHLLRPGSWLAFFAGGVLPLFSSVLLARRLRDLAGDCAQRLPAPSLPLRGNGLSFGTAWCQGFLEGGMLAFLSLYLLALGMSADAAGGLMAVTLVGVILFQVPVSWLADRFGKVRVLLGCYAVVALGLCLVPLHGPSFGLAAWLFLFGACSGALYPLGLALLSERVSESALPRAYAWYLAMECVGSQAGAAAMGQARDWWGETAMFTVGLGAVGLVLGLWALPRILRRYSPRQSESLQSDGVPRQAA